MKTARIEIGGGLFLAIRETGPADAARTLFCVHGLTRNAHDFDKVAAALADRYRVIAVDIAGRGASDWLSDPAGYDYPSYVWQCLTLLDKLGLPEVDWLGTSMGGLIALGVNSVQPQRIRRLILNDVASFIPKEALDRIATADRRPVFASLAEAEAHLRQRYADFGPISDADWTWMTKHSTRQEADGSYRLNFDPNLYAGFDKAPIGDVNLWPLWNQVQQPVLLLRGGQSGLLLRATALGMVARGGVDLVEFPDCGHAPSLFQPNQIAAIRDWLLKTE